MTVSVSTVARKYAQTRKVFAQTRKEDIRADEEDIRTDEEGIRADEEGIRADEEVFFCADEEDIRTDEEGIRADKEGIRADEEDEEGIRADEEGIRADEEVFFCADEEDIRADEECIRADEEDIRADEEDEEDIRADEEGIRADMEVNVNNSQNGEQHLDATVTARHCDSQAAAIFVTFDLTGGPSIIKGEGCTSRPAIGEQEKRIAILNEYCRKNPYRVQYDFIAHTDTLVEDLRLFFHRSGIVGKDGILPRQRPSRAKAGFGRTFRVVPPEDIRRLGEIYKPDFDMFGYSIEEDLEMIENALKQNV
ncbi:hypothetical protein Bbelb_198210 [Branchiostoma belcheri]|nr:hypothetical protein Bbelb_198210 [Branchiostoma belcheri]